MNARERSWYASRQRGPICMRCLEPGADRRPLLGWTLHSGCLVIWLTFAAEMEVTLTEVPGLLEKDGGPERWIPDDNERSGELDIGESAY
jgi:hypothetical protein